jgi:hypothetical protein
MIKRAFAGLPPRITFTRDYHELVRGDLRPGTDVRLRYDPARIVPPGEDYVFGDPAHRIEAHIIFPPGQDVVTIPLQSRTGMLTDPDIDVTGVGNMLTATAHVPENATSIVMWFTHNGPYDPTQYDSDEGRNFHFGFNSLQIRPLAATVGPGSSGTDLATVKVAIVPEVHRVVAHMRVVVETKSIDHDLKPTGEQEKDGWLVWALEPVPVPKGAVVRFKLYYWIGDIRYKDDNDGLYYLVYHGEPEKVPPPPPELAKAATAWG